MYTLIKKGFDKNNIDSFGNMFLIGNGHLGYRGTLEEYSNTEKVGLNVVGFYDQYKDLWRESLNLPNPFYVRIEDNNILKNNCVDHRVILNTTDATFERITVFKTISIHSKRFISQSEDNLLCFKYEINSLTDQVIKLKIGTDLNVYEINGPHYVNKSIKRKGNVVFFEGTTNENDQVFEQNTYIFDKHASIRNFSNGIYSLTIRAKANQKYTFYCFAKISEHVFKKDETNYQVRSFSSLLLKQKEIMKDKWNKARVIIKGNNEAQQIMDYSIYHLLILGNEHYQTSIPARGVSGQVYKGAIFWDTEIFLLPFYTLTNPSVAKALLNYRVRTINGAINKAKGYGYKGAFYAWEAQEDGRDGCSKYNITDPITNKPIRTYFDEKQIHISADISYAIFQYLKVTNDESFITENVLNMLKEIVIFYMSYATLKNGKYHLNSVIGPDEYHDLVDDNAFTNYLVSYILKQTIQLFKKKQYEVEFIDKMIEFSDKLYLNPILENGLLEQFDGYFDLEDCKVSDIKARLRHPLEYWGFVARNTKIIKQADVVSLLVLLSDYFTDEIKKVNFDYYYPRTEHGSSLSASMYSILASNIHLDDICYQMFHKSASIDLGTNQKMYAGGIYIGGTHPASNAGSYLSVVLGMAGLSFKDNKVSIHPSLPNNIKGLEFNILYQNKSYKIIINSEKQDVICND